MFATSAWCGSFGSKRLRRTDAGGRRAGHRLARVATARKPAATAANTAGVWKQHRERCGSAEHVGSLGPKRLRRVDAGRAQGRPEAGEGRDGEDAGPDGREHGGVVR